MDVLCPHAPAKEKKKRKKDKLKPPILHCVLHLSALFDFSLPPSPTLPPGFRLKMCECPSQLPRTQPVHITAQRHKLGSQGMREVQITLLSRPFSARRRAKSLAAQPLRLRLALTIAASSLPGAVPCRLGPV